MADSAGLNRRQQRLEELSAASTRALADDARLNWRRHVLYRAEVPIPAHAPHLRVAPEARDLVTLRGIGDAHALRLRYSDSELYSRTRPEQGIERLLFDLLEQLRVETLVPDDLPGVTTNIRARFLTWAKGFHASGLTDTVVGNMLYTVALVVWSQLNALPVPEEVEGVIEHTRASFGPVLGHALAGLRRTRHDQATYANYALELARTVAQAIQTAQEEQADDTKDSQSDVEHTFALLLDFDDDTIDAAAPARSGDSRVFHDTGQVYRIFTLQFDQETDAASQVRPELLREYRNELDTLIAQQNLNRSRLRRLLMTALATPRIDGRQDGEEEGQIDGRRLAGLVSSPMERRLFTQERVVYRAQCAVTFLIDCSGSMREQIRPVAILVDSLVRAMEQVGAITEVLGYTTGAWNGGRAYREWMRQGRPAHPGRMNEVCHRIFKPALRTWKQSRLPIAGMFKSDLFREGVDGEAVQWAASRLLSHDVPRRILVVVTDGCPMDTATALTNDEFYLDNHLRQVTSALHHAGQIEVMGVGLGLDLSPFYPRNVAIDTAEGLQNQAIYDVATMLRMSR